MEESGIAFVEPEDEIDLFHYASKYYDPAKAREYYLRTRELKGRSGSSEQLSAESRQKQAEAKTYVREQVRNERTAATKDAAAKQKARLDEMRANAEATRDRIVEKLEALVEKLKADIDVEVPKPKLNEIPASATPRQRAFLEKQNARMTSEYNGKVRRATKKAAEAAGVAREAAREEIKKVGSDLRDAVTKVRADYTVARQALADKYSSTLKTELQNIDEQVR